jgi:hypothetical protein
MSDQYTIRPDKFKELRKIVFIKNLPRLILMLIAVYAIAYFNMFNDSPSDFSLLMIMIIPFLTVLLIISFIIGFNRQRKAFESFKVILTESEIRREMKSMPTIRIRLENITSISRDKTGIFVIKGSTKEDVISLIPQVTNYERLEESLARIREIETGNQPSYYPLLSILLTLVMLSGMMIVYYMSDKWLLGLAGTITSVLMIWSFVKIQKSKNVTNGTRIRGYLMLLIMLSILITTYIKLTAN